MLQFKLGLIISGSGSDLLPILTPAPTFCQIWLRLRQKKAPDPNPAKKYNLVQLYTNFLLLGNKQYKRATEVHTKIRPQLALLCLICLHCP